MKIAIIVCCLVAVALAEKRAFLGSILNGAEIHNLVNAVVEKFGTDATEQQCESECTTISTNDILDMGCDFMCTEIQSLIKKLHT